MNISKHVVMSLDDYPENNKLQDKILQTTKGLFYLLMFKVYVHSFSNYFSFV